MSEETMENEVETNPLQDMIKHAIDQNFNKANDVFNDMMTVKMSDLLDQEKVNLASQIYNGEEPEEEDDRQLDLDLEGESDDDSDPDGDDEEESKDNSAEEELDDEEEISSE